MRGGRNWPPGSRRVGLGPVGAVECSRWVRCIAPKTLVLAEYDRMATAGLSLGTPLVDGENYTYTLTPPPGHDPRHPAAPEAD